MPPRRYSRENRDVAVAQTRRKILLATMHLHNRQGILATSFDDIAREADVAVATVYRHFPTLEHLVTGCGALTLQTIRPPVPEYAATLFQGVTAPAQRIEKLAAEFCSFYERSEQAWPCVLRDMHRLPQLQDFVRQHLSVLETYVREALRPLNPNGQTVAVAVALLDFPTWNSLVARGIARPEVPGVLAELLRCRTARASKPQPR